MADIVATFLPAWVRALGAVLLAVVLVVQARHAARTSGQRRWWHVAYAAMALGMIVMFALHPMDSLDLSPAPAVVLIVAVLGAVAMIAAMLRWRQAPAWWVIALVDAVTLAYIQIPAVDRPVIVCVLFAMYLAVTLVLRVVVAVRTLRGAPQRQSRVLVDPSGAAAGSAPATDPAPADVPISLAVLALSMLYMISI